MSLCGLTSSCIGWQDLGGHYIPELQVKKCSSTLPLPGGGPRAVRSLEQPWGRSDLTFEEEAMAREDDFLMWRSLMRRLFPSQFVSEVELGLEQPADPSHYMPEVVSFWETEEWKKMKRHYNLGEQAFNQSSWGGKATKPTTFGGNLPLRLYQRQM